METIEDPGGVWAALLTACDGTVGLSGLRSRLSVSGVDLSQSEIVEGVDALAQQGLIVDAFGDVDDEWSNQRFYIEQLSPCALDAGAAHELVRSTRALVVGAGGTGSWLALALAMMGVAELMVVDPDVVEDRNRTRQPYPASSVGRRKVEALGELVRHLRPDLAYAGVDLRVEHENDLTSLVGGMDVVACCADEPSVDAVATLIARACVPAGVPHLICGYHGPVGRVGPFWYPRRRPLPCAGCHSLLMHDAAAYPSAVESSRPRSNSAVSAAQPQLVGAVAAGEILHFRAGVRPATAGRLFALDLRTLASSRPRVRVRGDCPICLGGRSSALRPPPRVSSSGRR